MNTEFIICSAVHVDDNRVHSYNDVVNIKRGFVVTGRRHRNCLATITAILSIAENGKIHPELFLRIWHKDNRGFLTNTNRYVDRREGWKIAKAAGQIKFGLEASDRGEDSILISENLYND